MDFEFNPVAAVLAAIFGGIFSYFLWGLEIWSRTPIATRIIMTVLVFPLLYYVIQWRLGD
jgi:hypothetical protein